MSSAQVPEARYNIEFGWVWGMPQPGSYLEEQVGEYDEILVNIGGDCRNPEDLGADIEYTLGGQAQDQLHRRHFHPPGTQARANHL